MPWTDAGTAMKNDGEDFTLLERVMVVAILLFVAAIAIQNVLHSLRESEEDTVHAAATEYSGVRNMYEEQHRAVPVGLSSVNSTGASGVFNTPDR
jgi:type II secretory pathway pseudopilin PulG